MANEDRLARRLRRLPVAAVLAAGVTAVVAVAGPALAEETKKTEGGSKSSWVKLCEEAQISKDEKKNVCITHHERLDPNNGLPIISAAVREVDGKDKKDFLITVPLGMALGPGMKAKIDEEKETLELKYTFCLPNGCTAETEATPALLEQLAKGKMLVVVSLTAVGEQMGFQVPLNGFKQTLEGKPVDTAKFANARKQLLMRIRENMIAKANEKKKILDQAKQGAEAIQEGQPAPAEGEQQAQ